MNTLNIPSLASEQERTFHIHVPWDISEDIAIEISYIANDGTVTDDIVKYRNYNANETTVIDTRNVEVWKYLWRQKTMELMDKASKFKTITKDILREAVAKLGEKIKIFQEKHNLQNDDILNKLCDDLMVTLDSIDAEGGEKYINSRLSTQACERVYRPTLKRARNIKTTSALQGCAHFRSHQVQPTFRTSITQAALVRGCSGGTANINTNNNLSKPELNRGVSVPLPSKGDKHKKAFW